jgi:hypothetical protein
MMITWTARKSRSSSISTCAICSYTTCHCRRGVRQELHAWPSSCSPLTGFWTCFSDSVHCLSASSNSPRPASSSAAGREVSGQVLLRVQGTRTLGLETRGQSAGVRCQLRPEHYSAVGERVGVHRLRSAASISSTDGVSSCSAARRNTSRGLATLGARACSLYPSQGTAPALGGWRVPAGGCVGGLAFGEGERQHTRRATRVVRWCPPRAPAAGRPYGRLGWA